MHLLSKVLVVFKKKFFFHFTYLLTPIVAHQEYRVQRWISELRNFKSKPRPKKIFARTSPCYRHIRVTAVFRLVVTKFFTHAR